MVEGYSGVEKENQWSIKGDMGESNDYPARQWPWLWSKTGKGWTEAAEVRRSPSNSELGLKVAKN